MSQQVRVVFTDPAIDDLRRVGPSVAPRMLKKILLLETDPEAGAPPGGDLTGYRKLVVGHRHWRVVYRINDQGEVVVCEIWAADARTDGEVYAEASAHASLPAPREGSAAPLFTGARPRPSNVSVEIPRRLTKTSIGGPGSVIDRWS